MIRVIILHLSETGDLSTYCCLALQHVARKTGESNDRRVVTVDYKLCRTSVTVQQKFLEHTNHSDQKMFTPIGLSSFVLKPLERLIDLFIIYSLNPTSLSNYQQAYMKGRIVDSALHDEEFSLVAWGLQACE